LLVLLDVALLALQGSPTLGSGSLERARGASNFVMLVYVAGASVGQRGLNFIELNTLVDFIKEKTLRCQAKLNLEQEIRRFDEEVAAIQNDNRSEVASLPMTADTGKLFTSAAHLLHMTGDRLLGEGSSGVVAHRIYCGALVAVKLSLTSLNGSNWLKAPQLVNGIQWSPHKVLGEGSYGVVVHRIYCGALVAVKLSLTNLNGNSWLKAPQLVNEIRILRQVRHPNLVFF